MAPPLRNNPYTLLQNINRLRAAGRVKHLPPSYPALHLVPTTPLPPKGLPPSHTGAFQPEITIVRDTVKRQHPQTYKPHYFTKPEKIVYEEDIIRDAFYKWHPLELNIPRTLVMSETEIRQNVQRDWSTIYGGRPKELVTGEHVVQHTLFLMQAQKLSRHKAYKVALSAFYEARAAVEEAERRERAEKFERLTQELDELNRKERLQKVEEAWKECHPHSARFLEWEQESLAQGAQYAEKMMEAQRLREDTMQKMAQYEKRNLAAQAEAA
ncbi:mitochondrial ribosomal small subunit component [Gaertneriomyces sp. JEL0708]|nr:mitochondrial ribosomal small subunit component [Gaertneriomyces sp. JEL0708]